MARPDEAQRTSNGKKVQNLLRFKSTKAQPSPSPSPTFQQLLQSDSSFWSQKQKKNKSVLTKVKEKAKKLRHSFSLKKQNVSRSPTPPSNVAPKSHTAPTYQAPDNGKHEAPISTPSTTTNANANANAKESPATKQSQDEPSIILMEANPADTDAKNQVDDLPESTVSTDQENGRSLEAKTRSMKEYLMHKLEPGEDERALSQVITRTISPRRDKMRDVMSSFLKNDEVSESNSMNPGDLKSKSLPASGKMGSKMVKFSPSHTPKPSEASSNLNQTFKSTVVSYQNHSTTSNSLATSSSSSRSPTKTSSSPLANASPN